VPNKYKQAKRIRQIIAILKDQERIACSDMIAMQKRQATRVRNGIKTQKVNNFIEEDTSSAVGRSLGSKASSLSNKHSAKGSAFRNFCANGTGTFFLMLVKYLLALSFRTWIHNKR
jgi:hypothetical protein